jgi:predicted ATP-grasp superfamily ATP-dependent carboligase
MNILVTNTDATQSYTIVTALRPYANRIVATVEQGNRLRSGLPQAAYSRFVDKRYQVPSPVADWRAGNVIRENTAREDCFIQAVVQICKKEMIDVVFPSWDPYVYVLSKNKPLFDRLGVIIPVPDYDTVLMALDKYRTVQAALQTGFPCPRTYLYEDKKTLQCVGDSERFPLVIKPRVGSGGRGIEIVKDYAELLEKLPAVVRNYGKPMIQEYIPGRQRVSFPVLIDRDGDLKFACHKKIVRNFRVTARFGTVEESVRLDPNLLDNAVRLLKKMSWWGSVSVGTIRDPRDGRCKLMEINPRFSRNLWHQTELGVNAPWMCIKIARREPVKAIENYPEGVLFVCPFEDLQVLGLNMLDLMIHKFRLMSRRAAPVDSFSRPASLKQQIRSFVQVFSNKQRRIFNTHFKYFLQDPVVSILWWLRFSAWVLGACKQLGK